MLTAPRTWLNALLVASLLAGAASACPFCPVSAPTVAEQQANSDVVLLGSWVGGEPEGDEQTSHSIFEVVEVFKAPDAGPKKGDRIRVPPYYEGTPGNLFLLMARQEETLQWDAPQPVTETGWQYVAQAPPLESPPEKRLAYFARFLEYPDDFISADAFAEFGRARYEDVAPLGKGFPRERVRGWLENPLTLPPRTGFYGLLLGLCGNADDAEFLKAKILEDNDRGYRLGLDGMIGGYLLLTGPEGLDVIDRATLGDPRTSEMEANAVMNALRFLWTYGDGDIDHGRLKQSMRLLLERESLMDLAITDLARWKDWEVMDRLMALYDRPFDDPTTQQKVRAAIIGYLLASQRDVAEEGIPVPAHVERGARYLDALREKDPVAVKNVERFGF